MKIKIFKISTMEMCIFQNKMEFWNFIVKVTNTYPDYSMSVKKLMEFLPKEEYSEL